MKVTKASSRLYRNATAVEEIAFNVNDPGQPYYWEDATDPTSWCYPPAGEAFTVEHGIYTIYLWARDDYCEYGSTNSAYIEIIGS